MSPRSKVWTTWAAVLALGVPLAAEAQDVPVAGPRVRSSWTSDRTDVSVGDIVTVLIDELTLAEANRDESAVQERDRDLSLSGGSGSTTAGGSLRTTNDVSRASSGASTRRDRFAAEMSARVVELSPSGAVRIEGTKKVMIDQHEQEVVVRGWIRTQDLSLDNTVESWRVADAEIRYGSNGELVKAGGIWSRLLGMIVP